MDNDDRLHVKIYGSAEPKGGGDMNVVLVVVVSVLTVLATLYVLSH